MDLTLRSSYWRSEIEFVSNILDLSVTWHLLIFTQLWYGMVVKIKGLIVGTFPG